MVLLRFGESEIVALFRERHDFKPGDTLHLKPRRDQVHLFHPQTGKQNLRHLGRAQSASALQ